MSGSQDTHDSGDTCDVRPTEQLDWTALAAYLRRHLSVHQIKGVDLSRQMAIAQFPGGHSNLTYLVRFGDAELVIRRAPLGPVPPRAHDMAREFRWLQALNPIFPLAPRPFLLCEDPSVVGSVFYVMERRRGIVVRHEEPAPIAGHPENRRRVSEALVDTLAGLHAIDVTSDPVSALGKPAGFVDRQVRGWSERWEGAKLSEVPEMEALSAWLLACLPPDPAQPAVVHGDFKLDNLLLDPLDVGRVVAVFDWEMSALGDPLVDVGVLLVYHWWAPTLPLSPGWFGRDEIIERYAAQSRRDVSAIRFYEVFALFKIAVVVQQIFCRYRRGQTDDARFATFGDRVMHLARRAVALAS